MKKKILIIDDDRDYIQSLKMTLEPAGYEILTAHNATQGFGEIVSKKPDLIILDVMMETETAGFVLAKRLRSAGADAVYREIPILMLTAVGWLRKIFEEESGSEVHVDAFMEKPVPPKELLRTVRELLEASSA